MKNSSIRDKSSPLGAHARGASTRQPLFTRAFVLAALATLMLSFAAFSFVHLPGFLLQLGAGEAEIGRIMAAQAIGSLLAWPFVGRVMDRYGRRVVILGGSALFVVVTVCYCVIDSIGWVVYLVRVLDGVAHTMWFTALFTYGADLVPAHRRTEGLAIFGASGLVTIGLGAQFGDVVLAYAGYRELFLGAFGFALLGLLLSLWLRDVHHDPGEPSAPARGIFEIVAQPNLLPVWVAATAFFVALATLFIFMKTFVLAIGVGRVGGFYTAYTVVAVALRLLLGWIPDRLGPKRVLSVALGSLALGIGLLAFAHGPMPVLVAGLLCGVGHGYTYPVLFGLVVERAKLRERGSAMAFYTTIDALSPLIAGPLFGYVIERGGYDTAFMALALLPAIGVGLFYGLDRRVAVAAPP